MYFFSKKNHEKNIKQRNDINFVNSNNKTKNRDAESVFLRADKETKFS